MGVAEVRRQGAPRTCRCIETLLLSVLLGHHLHVREHHAPAGALRPTDGADIEAKAGRQGAPRACKCIKTTSPLLHQFTIASLMGASVCVVHRDRGRGALRPELPAVRCPAPHPRAPQYGSPAGSSAPPQTSVKRIARRLFRRDRRGRHGRERSTPTPVPELVAPAQAPLMTGRPGTRIRLGSVTCGRGFAILTFQGGGTLCARRCSNTAVRRRL